MRRLALVTTWLAALAAPASADPADDAAPSPTRVSVKLDGMTARFTVRYHLDLAGPSWSFAGTTLATPQGSLVTDATVAVDGAKPRRLLLGDPEAASDKLVGVGSAGAAEDRSWMFLLSESKPGGLSLGYAVPRHSSVELTLAVSEPTCFVNDMRYAAIPAEWRPKLKDAVIRDLGDSCSDAGAGPEAAWVAFPTREVADRASGARFRFTAGEALTSGTSFARVELDLASKLGDVPDDLATAFVIDTSVSLSAYDLDVERSAIAAYLRAAPSSKVQVIAFARTAAPLLSSWTSASDAGPAIDTAFAAIALKNGSNLDAGLAAAKSWLDRTGGTKRVIVLTDAMLADRVTQMPIADLRAKAGAALIHVIDVHASGATFERDDTLPLAHLALDSGGIAVHAPDPGEPDATMLARPTTFDNLRVSGPGWEHETLVVHNCEIEGDNRMPEGSHCLWFGEGDVATSPVTVEGYVWGKHVVQVLTPEAGASLDVARELVGIGFESERGNLALAAYAIDSAWSMSATWGGDGGYADLGSFGYGISATSGCGCSMGDRGGVTIGHIGSAGQPHYASIEAQLAPALAACHVEHAELDLELTRDEIVDVHGDNACVAEHAWDVMLRLEHTSDHEKHHVTI